MGSVSLRSGSLEGGASLVLRGQGFAAHSGSSALGSNLAGVHVTLCGTGAVACTVFEGMYSGGVPCAVTRLSGTEIRCTTGEPSTKHTLASPSVLRAPF